MSRPLNRLGRAELGGLFLLMVWIAWAAASARLAGGTLPLTSPYVMAPVALATGVALGGFLAAHVETAVVTAMLVALTSVQLIGSLSSAAPILDLGYTNANAAVSVQVIGLCGLAMLRPSRTGRGVLAVAATAALGVAAVSRSMGGVAAALSLLLLVAATHWRIARGRSWRRVAAITTLAAILAAALTALRLASQSDWPALAIRTLDPARRSLWRDAFALWREHPVTGGGPGSFQQFSALARDPDTMAAHSSVLQVGAETGWVGVVLFGLIVIGGLLWAARGASAYAVVGVATWAVLVMHSFGDHLLEFPPVVLTAGMVIGWAGATRGSEELDIAEREGPRRR